MKLTEFYAALATLARGYEPQGQGPAIDTFAVVQSRSDLNGDTLGKDHRYLGERYFFSRKWEETGRDPGRFGWRLPGLFAWQNLVDDKGGSNLQDCFVEVEFTLMLGVHMPGAAEDVASGLKYEEREELLLDLYNYLTWGLNTYSLWAIETTNENLLRYALPTKPDSPPWTSGLVWATDNQIEAERSEGRVAQFQFLTDLSSRMVEGPVRGALVKEGFAKVPLAYLATFRVLIDMQKPPEPKLFVEQTRQSKTTY